MDPVPMGGSRDPATDVAAHAVRDRLEGVISDDARNYSHVSQIVAAGKAYREITREASERGSELIVLGAHGGHAGLAAFGSTTNHVVREASCPVLTVKAS
jgi:universal stress protein A